MDSLATGDVFLCFIKAGWVGLGVARETSVASLPSFSLSLMFETYRNQRTVIFLKR